MGQEIACPLSHEVIPRNSGVTSHGFACGWTGERCNPGDQCEGYRRLAAKQQRDYDEWIEEASRAHPRPKEEDRG